MRGASIKEQVLCSLQKQLESEGACKTSCDVGTESKPLQHEKVAIVGYSCILPGGENVNEAWEMIQAGIDNIRDLPNDRVDVTAYYSPTVTEKDKIYCTRGGFIPNFTFEPREFNFNMLQMEDTDTNQTLSLLKVKEALESAGINPSGSVKKNIGCVLGIGGGQKASNEFYSRLNYTVVEKVLRKIGMPEDDVRRSPASQRTGGDAKAPHPSQQPPLPRCGLAGEGGGGQIQSALSRVAPRLVPRFFGQRHRRALLQCLQPRRHELCRRRGVRLVARGRQGGDR